MSPDPTSVLVGAAGVLALGGGEFFKRIAGKLGDDVGELASALTTYRLRNLADRLRGAQELTEASGRPVQPIPPRLLVPLIEGASLEDDAALQARWEALIASAATARDAEDVSPYFAEILSQLTPFAARVLATLADPPFEIPIPDGWSKPRYPVAGVKLVAIARYLDAPADARLEAALDVLVAIGVVIRAVEEPDSDTFLAQLAEGPKLKYAVSVLGQRFLAACTPATSPSSEP
jgi:hypothetical protein